MRRPDIKLKKKNLVLKSHESFKKKIYWLCTNLYSPAGGQDLRENNLQQSVPSYSAQWFPLRYNEAITFLNKQLKSFENIKTTFVYNCHLANRWSIKILELRVACQMYANTTS